MVDAYRFVIDNNKLLPKHLRIDNNTVTEPRVFLIIPILPDIPIKCSAEILEAISDAPIAHQVSEPSARKKSFELVVPVRFL